MLPLLIVFSYLMGSIPTGYILVKKKLNKDVRDYGSGNIGATNVRRVAGEKLSKITAICDMLKAIIPVLLTRILIWTHILNTNESLSLSLVAIAPILGHNYTIFLKFKGGKGVLYFSCSIYDCCTYSFYNYSNYIFWFKIIY